MGEGGIWQIWGRRPANELLSLNMHEYARLSELIQSGAGVA